MLTMVNKNILIFFGSPRQDGFTSKMLKFLLANIKKCDNIIKIDAYKTSAKPCIDCGFCKKMPKCAFKDMDKIYYLIENSDVIVVATPIYSSSFPSPFKAILDRFHRYYCNKFFFKSKIFYKQKSLIILISSGRNDAMEISSVKRELSRTFSLINARLVKTVHNFNTDKKNISDYEPEDDVKKEILEALELGGVFSEF